MFFKVSTLQLTIFADHLHTLEDADSVELKHEKKNDDQTRRRPPHFFAQNAELYAKLYFCHCGKQRTANG